MKIPVSIKLNPSYEPEGLDEVSISSDDPYLNFVLHLPKAKTRNLATGPGALELTAAELEKLGDAKEKANEEDDLVTPPKQG